MIYELEADDLVDAVTAVNNQEVTPLKNEHLCDESDQLIEMISAERIDRDSIQAPAPVPEMANLYRRLGKPVPAEVKPFTVVLLVPGELQEKAGCPEVFVGHPFAISARAAITEAQVMASVERDAPDNNENAFELLAVFEGHHDELLLDDAPPPAPRQSPKPVQELKRVADQLSNDERVRLISVIQKFLWWDAANFCWNRDLPPSLATLDFIADVLDRAGLRPAEIHDDNP